MPFSTDIAGHAGQIASLRRALEQDRLHHAYVFAGPEGVGKRTVAVALAKALHCSDQTHDFCGRCASCVKIENRNHPDVRLIEPLPGKKEISIEQMRSLEKALNYRAFSGKRKVGIVDAAELLNFPAQNALLKTLEEPPDASLLILVASSAGALLPTVLSRCLRLSFAPLSQSDMARYLVERRQMTEQRAKILAAISLGSLGRALSPDIEELGEKRQAWVEAIALSRDAGGWAAFAEELAKDRGEALQFLDWLAAWYRDILIYSATQETADLCNRDLLDEVQRQAAEIDMEAALRLRSRALAASARIRRNVNRRLALENLFLKIAGSY
jgi:DNA polymerase-3 subunit delta'